MAGGKRLDRRGSGPIFWVLLVVVVFALFSVMMAASTADDCGSGNKQWQFFPPQWECVGNRGVGFG